VPASTTAWRTNGTLKQHPDETTSDDDDDGHFDTRDEMVDDVDSGGPFYVSNRILGVVFGSTHTGLSYYDYYTSVPHHLNWILSTIGFRWRGLPVQADTRYTGTIVQSLATTERICQYACEKTGSCEAYNFYPPALPGSANCNLYTGITGAVTSTGWKASLKHGARTGNANDVVGFVRTDNANSVVHKALDGNLHELVLSGTQWGHTVINPSATVDSNLSVYRRTEGVDAIVFRSATNHIIQVQRASNGWTDEADLTAITGAPNAVGNPMAYVRADGVNAIVHRAGNTIIELRRGSRGWISSNLLSEAMAPSDVDAASDPVATARSDGYSSVVFRGTDNRVYELYRAVGGDWHVASPSALASGPAAADRPFVYVQRDGTNSIVYRTAGGGVAKLTLGGSTWSVTQIGAGAIGQPIAYVRTDGATPVVFRHFSNHIVQVTAATTDLTDITGAPTTATSPAAYVRNDGFNSVIFESSSNSVREFFVKRGGTWATGNISSNAGETP
jgi:hypothetical protein